MEALFVDRLKIVDVAELEEYTGRRLRQGECATVMQSENDVLSPRPFHSYFSISPPCFLSPPLFVALVPASPPPPRKLVAGFYLVC